MGPSILFRSLTFCPHPQIVPKLQPATEISLLETESSWRWQSFGRALKQAPAFCCLNAMEVCHIGRPNISWLSQQWLTYGTSRTVWLMKTANYFFVCLFVFEATSHSVALADLELTAFLPASVSLVLRLKAYETTPSSLLTPTISKPTERSIKHCQDVFPPNEVLNSQAFKPSSQEKEVGGSLWIPGRPGMNSETLSRK